MELFARLQDVVDNISLAENNKCYAISFTRTEAVIALFSVLSGMSEGAVRSYFKRKVSNGRAKVIINLEKDLFQDQSWSTLDNIPLWILEQV